MWEFLSSLPFQVSTGLLVLAIIAIVIISLKGKVKAKFGGGRLGGEEDNVEVFEIGGGNDKENPRVQTEHTVAREKRRSCGDCILLIMGEREKFELKARQEYEKILKTQMNFVGQKLLEIQSSFMRNILTAISAYSSKNTGAIDQTVHYKLAYGLFKDAMMGVKDEIRRSFKENGFCELENSALILFVRDEIAVINSILNQYIRNMFPDRPGILSQEDFIAVLNEDKDSFLTIFTDIYSFARTVKIDAHNNIEEFKEEFSQRIDDFIIT